MDIDIKIKTNPFHSKNYYLDMDFYGNIAFGIHPKHHAETVEKRKDLW